MLKEVDLIQIHLSLEYLRQASDMLDEMPDKTATALVPGPTLALIGRVLNMARLGLVILDIDRILELLDGTRAMVNKGGPVPRQPVVDSVKTIDCVVKHEIRCAKFFYVPRLDVSYVQYGAIDSQLRDRFAEGVYDLEEANYSLAFGRFSACVYHCMCALETVFPELKARAQDLGVDCADSIDLEATWGQMLNKMDAELKKHYQLPRQKRNKKKYSGLSQLIAYMRALQIAWRDNTMHARARFKEGEAKSILEQTMGLFHYLASCSP